MRNCTSLWKVLSPLAACFMLFGVSVVMMGCAGAPQVGVLGAACATSDDCTSGLECRAKKCRNKIPNTKPTAVLRVDPTKGVKVGDKVLLIGENSRDAEFDNLTYNWKLDGPKDSKIKLTNPKEARTFFTPDVAGDYTVSLVVNDGKLDSELVSLTVKVEEADNGAPLANAGPDQEVLPGTKVQLDGTASSDPDGDKLTYSWVIKSKPDGSNASLDKPEFDKPSFEADLPGDYIIALIVTDIRNAKSQEDTVTVRSVKDLDKVPSIDSINPTEAVAQSVLDVVVKGKDFVDGAILLIGSKSIDKVSFVSTTELKVKLDLNGVTPGENDVKIINPNRKESNAVKFNVKPIPVPELTEVKPALAPTGARIVVKITGSNFIQKSEIYFETTPLKTTYISETEISAELDLRTVTEGDYKLSVRNPGGITSKTELTFKVIRQGPPPILKVLNPPQGTTGKKFAFSVHGTGFEIGAKIIFDGKELPTKRIRRDELQADPELDLTNIPPGTYDVWVRNIDGQNSTKEKFTVDGVDPTPKLDRVLPFIIYIGEKTKLSVFGTSFSPQAKFFIDGKSIPVNAKRSSTTFLEADFDGTTGSWQPKNYKAHVENPGGKKSNDFQVTITHPTPSVDAVTPGGWNIGCDVDVTITGRNFVASSEVNFGSTKFTQTATDPKLKLTRKGSTELSFKVLKANLSLTTYNVNVSNGPNAKSTDYKFPVLNTSNVPGIRSVRPGAAPADSSVTVTVAYDSSVGRFLPGAYIEVGGKRMATTCRLSFDNRYCYDISAKIDLAGIKPGTVQLYAVNPCGKKSAAYSFVVTEAPVPYLSKIEPAFGTAGQKTILTLKGRDFAKGHKLYVNNKIVPTTFVSDKELKTTGTVDFAGITAGTDIDIYILHDNGKKTPVVKYSIMAANPTLTITGLSADKFDIAKSHANVEVSGSGFTTNSELFMDGTKLTVSYNGPSKLTIGTLNLTNATGGIKLLQVKDSGKTSNTYPLFAAPPPPPVIDYLSPASRVRGSTTSTYLYIYGSQFCPGTTGRCGTNPLVKVTGPDKKDYSSAHSIRYSYDRYIYGDFNLTGLPEGAFIFVATMPGGAKSNPGVFNHSPPPPPQITSVGTSPFRLAGRTITLTGSGFTTGDTVIINGNILNKVAGTATNSGRTFTATYDFGSLKYAGTFDIYIERCSTGGKCIKSNVSKITVIEIPPSTGCSITNNCKDYGLDKTNEACTTYNGGETCRPKCTKTSDCTGNFSGAPTTAACTGGFCK